MKSIQNGKEEIKPSVHIDSMIIYTEKYQEILDFPKQVSLTGCILIYWQQWKKVQLWQHVQDLCWKPQNIDRRNQRETNKWADTPHS